MSGICPPWKTTSRALTLPDLRPSAQWLQVAMPYRCSFIMIEPCRTSKQKGRVVWHSAPLERHSGRLQVLIPLQQLPVLDPHPHAHDWHSRFHRESTDRSIVRGLDYDWGSHLH